MEEIKFSIALLIVCFAYFTFCEWGNIVDEWLIAQRNTPVSQKIWAVEYELVIRVRKFISLIF